jgi:hypothetical protein
MSLIYCLYSTGDGLPRYIGQTHDNASHAHQQHLAAALDRGEKGSVCDWIRDVLRRDQAVGMRVIQDDIDPKYLAVFERYWTEQFPKLLNKGAPSRRTPTATGQRIIEAIQSAVRKDQERDV